MKNFLKENLVLLAISFLCFASEPAILLAQTGGIDPRPFTQALNLSRGALDPKNEAARYLTQQDACTIAINDWGWQDCEGIDAMALDLAEGVDNVVINTPNTDGFVKLSDWDGEERAQAVRDISASLADGLKAQGQQLGQEIRFLGWRTEPTLNQEKKYLYYATDTSWDGDTVTNITASVFDRKGFIEFNIVPIRSDLSSAEVEGMINSVLDLYSPKPEESYSSYISGDKVAAVGAIGVLAGLVGVKYGKAATGILVTLLFFLKKFFFLLFIPFIWVGKLFKRNKG